MDKVKNISAIIHTKNAAATLTQALESVSFAGEIIVVDMQSSDDSRLIAQKYGATVVSVENTDFVEPARQFGIDQATKDWILILDADEVVPDTLRVVLLKLSETASDVSGYYLPRLNLVFGKWLKHTGWWPDYQLRFFKRGTVTWPKTLHAQPTVQGKTEKLAADEKFALKHYNYTTVEEFINRLNRYTSLETEHSSHDYSATEALTPAAFFKTFTGQFLSRYFKEEGYKDGLHGMSLALLQSMYELTVGLKLWQKQKFADNPSTVDKAAMIAEFRNFQKELNYWLADWEAEESSGLTKLWRQLRRKLKI